MDYKFARSDFKYIDAHAHFFPHKLFQAIWRYWDLNYKPLYPLWNIKYKLDGDVNKMAKFLNSRNVIKFATLNYAHKKDVAEGLIEWTRKFSKDHPDAIPFSTVYPADENLLQYTERALNDYQFKGIKLQLLVTDFHVHDERLVPIFKLIQELDKIMVIHMGTAPGRSPYVGIKHFKKIIEKFPDIKYQITHFGGFEYKEFLKIVDDYPNIYLDTCMIFIEHNVFDDRVEKQLGGLENIKQILEEHENKILWGTDFPNIPYDYDLAKDSLLRFNLSKNFYNKVFFENATRLYEL